MRPFVVLALVAATGAGVHATPPRPPAPPTDPDEHALVAALRAAFGAQIWRCTPHGGCGLAVRDIHCRASATGCTALLDAHPIRAAGPAVADLVAALAEDGLASASPSIACGLEHPTARVHCRFETTAGDDVLDGAVAPFEMWSLGQHARTPAPIAIRCRPGACTATPDPAPAAAPDPDADRAVAAPPPATDVRRFTQPAEVALLARTLAARGCVATTGCRVTCESSGMYDGGLTTGVACTATPTAATPAASRSR